MRVNLSAISFGLAGSTTIAVAASKRGMIESIVNLGRESPRRGVAVSLETTFKKSAAEGSPPPRRRLD
jgi:hypothetical protein